MSQITSWSIPLVIFIIVAFGYIKGVNVFDAFVKGAGDGLLVATKILPALVALITAVGIFKASGALDLLTFATTPFAELLKIPTEVVPLALLRPISGSGAMVIFNDLLNTFGADSLVGRVASVIEGSTETTFYTIAVYFGAVGIKKTRHTVVASLAADLTGFVLSAMLVRALFY